MGNGPMKTYLPAALLAATALTAPAHAQTAPTADDIAALKAQIDALQAKVAELEAQMQASKAPAAAASAAPATPVKTAEAAQPSWRGGPLFEDKKSGFSFKPSGFLQFDTGYVGNPDDALTDANLGWRTRARRIVFGGQGTLPGGFGYKAEFNFTNGDVGYEDVVLTWQAKGVPLLVTVGNHFPLSGLEATSSSRIGSVLEREQATDAFGFGRRIGASLGLVDPKDRYTLTAGIYQTAIDADTADNQWQASARATWAPRIGDKGRIHLGLNYQHREYRTDVPQARYRARPFTQLTDFRFVDTGVLNLDSDDVLGAELVGIYGPFHFASEGHKLWVNGYRPSIGNDNAGTVLSNGPDFFSGYAEIGWYLTGETRAYKGGRWDRVKVLNPIDKGGMGAFQLNARLDHLDLTDRFVSDVSGLPILINGGEQTGYQFSMIWNPVEYLRFLLQYSHIEIEGGPRAEIVRPDSTRAVEQRRYDTDSVALRAQIEF